MYHCIARSIAAVLVILVVATQGWGQKPIKVDVTKYYDKLIPPAPSSRDAYQKAKCSDSSGTPCSDDPLFDALRGTLIGHLKDLAAADAGAGGDMMKQMQDPDFQKKLASMSQEEKMKFAMEMAQQMKPPEPTTAESPQVTSVMREAGKINDEVGQEDMKRMEKGQSELAYRQKIDAEHKAIDTWQQAEIERLPVIHDKTEDHPDPKGVHRVKLEAIDKHLAIVDRELKAQSAAWSKDVSAQKLRYGKFASDLAAIHYGDDAANDVTRNMLSMTQRHMLTDMQMLLERSNQLWNDAANWYEKKVEIQNEKLEGMNH